MRCLCGFGPFASCSRTSARALRARIKDLAALCLERFTDLASRRFRYSKPGTITPANWIHSYVGRQPEALGGIVVGKPEMSGPDDPSKVVLRAAYRRTTLREHRSSFIL